MRRRRGVRRTVRQMLMNPSSGVPLANDAANLSLFFSPDGADIANQEWSADRGDLKFLAPETPADISLGSDGTFHWVAGGLALTEGSFPAIPSGSDALIMVVGKHSVVDAGHESPSLTFRMGANNSSNSGGGDIRVRVYPTLVGDYIQDDSGTSFGGGAASDGLEREYHDPAGSPPASNDDNVYIATAVLDTSNGLWIQRGWRGTTPIHSNSLDVSALGDITLMTHEQTGSAVESDCTLHGYYHGVGMWVFPSGIPDDWEAAALGMGEAWMNGKYTFWPAWGKD